MAVYTKPEKRVHRGFFYLDDEVVINSLSAVEAGKIDEVVSKVNSAREGGFGGGAGLYGAKLEGGKKTSSAFEEEIVRTRTRFSVFELWLQNIYEHKAVGRFNGWGPDALDGVRPGDTIELEADLQAAPIQTLLRTYLWFVERAKQQGNPFSLKGEELKEAKEAERMIRFMLGDGDQDETLLLATPAGEPGPVVGMPVRAEWTVGDLGRLGGQYTVIAQVDRILREAEELPTMRLVQGVAASPVEVEAMKSAVNEFAPAAQEMKVTVTDNEASIVGPGLWLSPIAIFR